MIGDTRGEPWPSLRALWKNLASRHPPTPSWIGGESRGGAANAITVRSPIDGRTLATIKSATPADVDRAIDAARRRS